jgi:hypothetical protein
LPYMMDNNQNSSEILLQVNIKCNRNMFSRIGDEIRKETG